MSHHFPVVSYVIYRITTLIAMGHYNILTNAAFMRTTIKGVDGGYERIVNFFLLSTKYFFSPNLFLFPGGIQSVFQSQNLLFVINASSDCIISFRYSDTSGGKKPGHDSWTTGRIYPWLFSPNLFFLILQEDNILYLWLISRYIVVQEELGKVLHTQRHT